MPKIAVSYRRTDSDVTGRIFDRLKARYGQGSVFRDIDSIPFGANFRKEINDALKDADALIAIVGPDWRGGESQDSARINQDNDLVRIEIETALQRGILLIPVLVGGAPMPQSAELPASLREFSSLNAAAIDSGRNFDTDCERLVRSMDALFEGSLAHNEPGPVHPAPVAPQPTPEPITHEEFVYVCKPLSKKGPTWELRLGPDALEFTDGQNEGRIYYDQIVEVLLTYKQAEIRRVFSTRIVSRIVVPFSISSVSFENGREEYKDGTYGKFIRELHRRVARAGTQASFYTGSRPAEFWTSIGRLVLGVFIGGLGGGILAASDGNVVGGVCALLFFIFGLLTFPSSIVRPRRYRPDGVPDGFVPRGY
jgi:hypothetical protein